MLFENGILSDPKCQNEKRHRLHLFHTEQPSGNKRYFKGDTVKDWEGRGNWEDNEKTRGSTKEKRVVV